MRIDGNVAIITGSGRGLGRAMALALADAGADIVVTARTKPEIEETAECIRHIGRKALAVACDVTQKSSVDQMVKRALIEFGQADTLVNNAGVAIVKPFLDFSPEAFYTRPMKFVLDDATLGKIRRKKIPLKRNGKPDEIGPLAVYLASRASDFMTGEIIYIDGGELAKL